jgi:hypothetical protein
VNLAENSVGSSEDRRSEHLGSDPTLITTDVIRREIAHLSDRVDLKIEGVVNAINARIDAIDRATKVFADDLNRVPTDLQTAMVGEHAVMVEKFVTVDVKFAGVQAQIAERDDRVEATAVATKTAVDAALAAAEKARISEAQASAAAASKSEASFSKTADQQRQLFDTSFGALRDQMEELRRQVVKIEAIAIGQQGQKTEQHQASSATMALVALAVTVLSVLIGLAMRFVGR